MKKIIRMRIVHFLVKYWPNNFCWTACVNWALNQDGWNVFKIDSAKPCKTESKEKTKS